MAVVTTVFNTFAGQRWATGSSVSSLVADDPVFKVNTQLTNWISTIGNSNWIRKYTVTTDPVAIGTIFGSGPYAWWDLVLNEGVFQEFGLRFMLRNLSADPPTSVTQYRPADFSVSTTEDGPGMSEFSSYIDNWDFDFAGTHFIAHEASGATPWFVYCYKENAATYTDYCVVLARPSLGGLTAGSYYPASGLGKWILWFPHEEIYTAPQNKYGFPAYYGIYSYRNTQFFVPRELGYFASVPTFYGDIHSLGQVSTDFLLSNVNAAAWGDSLEIDGITYTCLRMYSYCLWVKTST